MRYWEAMAVIASFWEWEGGALVVFGCMSWLRMASCPVSTVPNDDQHSCDLATKMSIVGVTERDVGSRISSHILKHMIASFPM